MFVCDNVDRLIELLKERKAFIYGTGYIASLFFEALKKNRLENNIAGFVVSEFAKNSDRNFEGYEINQINEIDFADDMIVCIAVHDCLVGEIESLLKRNGVSNFVWIYPYLFDLYYGNPIQRGEWIDMRKLIPKDEERYALAVRWAAVADYYGKCPNGFAWYKRAMTYLHNAQAAEARVKTFTQLIQNWQTSGYDGKHEIAINENYEIIDGEHRMAVALYHGEKRIKCRIYSGKNVNSEKSFMKKKMLIECGFDEGEIKLLDTINDCIRKRLEMEV